MKRPEAEPRSAFAHFEPLTTRWMDNDIYGHLNNVVYLSLFDTAVNQYLIAAGALDIHAGTVIGLVVETHCNFFDSLAYPQKIDAGLRVGRQGRSPERVCDPDGRPTTAAPDPAIPVRRRRGPRTPARPVGWYPPPRALRRAGRDR